MGSVRRSPRLLAQQSSPKITSFISTDSITESVHKKRKKSTVSSRRSKRRNTNEISHPEETETKKVSRLKSSKGGEEPTIARTESFEPISHSTFDPTSKVKIHTLILGTHPSVISFAEGQYYGNALNTFWWIAGDNLGFRRSTGISALGKPYKFTEDLLYSNEHIIPYKEQVERLTSKGFALWDVLHSCERKGSLDSNIKNGKPNKIREFCAQHPTIKRIVLSGGKFGADSFNKYFKDWWLSGQLKPGSNKESIAVFQEKYKKMLRKLKDKDEKEIYSEDEMIECVCGLGVSPAAAKFRYVEKRDFYTKYCYAPGLDDHKRINE